MEKLRIISRVILKKFSESFEKIWNEFRKTVRVIAREIIMEFWKTTNKFSEVLDVVFEVFRKILGTFSGSIQFLPCKKLDFFGFRNISVKFGYFNFLNLPIFL